MIIFSVFAIVTGCFVNPVPKISSSSLLQLLMPTTIISTTPIHNIKPFFIRLVLIGPFIYNILASQILHERVLFLTNFVQRYGLFQYVVSKGAIFLKSKRPKGC